MPDKIVLDNISVILNGPKFPENIGAAARALCNMGLGHLAVVRPENCDLTRVLRMATWRATDIVETMEVYDDLKTALSEYNYVVGTTARLGGERQVISNPSALAQKLIPISQQNRVAILFGPEDRGLTNEDLRLCHALVNIPTADFSSLNLAQSVMIMCYEIFTASQEKPAGEKFTPRLACRYELDGMYDQLKDILVRINYINPENPDYWMNNIRGFFTRLQFRAKEVRMIRGIIRQVNWYSEKRYNDGLEDGKKK